MDVIETAAGRIGSAEIRSEEHWARKGPVDLYLYRKRPANAADPPILFLVHGSSFSGRTTYDLDVPGRPGYSMMDVFAGFGFDVWTGAGSPTLQKRRERIDEWRQNNKRQVDAAFYHGLLAFFKALPNKDKQFAFLPGQAHATHLGLNRARFFRLLRGFLTMPARADGDSENLF